MPPLSEVTHRKTAEITLLASIQFHIGQLGFEEC